MSRRLVFSILILQFSGGFCNTIESLGNAGRVLAHLPINEAGSNTKSPPSVSEVVPTYFDLAISRLQSKTDEVISNVWKSLDDKRQRVILSEKGKEYFFLIHTPDFSINSNFLTPRKS